MEMRYKDFKKIEATYYFMLNIKNGKTNTKQNSNKDKVMQDLSNLEKVNASDLNLSEEYMEIFK